MAKIENLDRLMKKLRLRQAAALRDSKASVAVGFEAAGALRLHEMIEPSTLGLHKPRPGRKGRPGIGWFWGPPDYGPKFLEAPARELAPELGAMVRKAVQAKVSFAQALFLAGDRLKSESQRRVPREQGFLFRSAFCKLENS